MVKYCKPVWYHSCWVPGLTSTYYISMDTHSPTTTRQSSVHHKMSPTSIGHGWKGGSQLSTQLCPTQSEGIYFKSIIIKDYIYRMLNCIPVCEYSPRLPRNLLQGWTDRWGLHWWGPVLALGTCWWSGHCPHSTGELWNTCSDGIGNRDFWT